MMVYFEGENGVICIDRARIVGAAQMRTPTDFPTNVWVDFEPGFIRVRNGFDDVQARLIAAQGDSHG